MPLFATRAGHNAIIDLRRAFPTLQFSFYTRAHGFPGDVTMHAEFHDGQSTAPIIVNF